ncbi:AAA family ATPase [Akkermansia sp.]|uniref:AAA family ATPase n=1 Tax=Akkermansia sp. TaxID=1872421 RepID=UPI0025BFE30E|nr:AAA family ATPase [Akkermansia sp.]
MKVEIQNFAKIGKASLEINGLTVVAGENNTGKSTIGKILFAFFDAASEIDKKINDFRYKSINNRISNFISNKVNFNIFFDSKIEESISKEVFTSYKNDKILNKNEIFEILKNSKDINFENLSKSEVESLYKNIFELFNLSDEKIKLEIFTRCFVEVFNSQINSLLEQNSDAVINLTVKGIENKLIFRDNLCRKLDCSTIISNNCIYIDDPFILDECSVKNHRRFFFDYKKRKTIDFLEKYFQADLMDNLIESVVMKSKMEDVFSKLNDMAEGKVVTNNGVSYFKQKGYKEDINLGNLSAGVKSVVILKMLVEKLLLKEKDLLVLDEPEIHLHPEWQLVYAEVIVLLQKALSLHVVITTHSPYFLNAIELYSKKHENHSQFKSYVSHVCDSGQVTFTDVTDCLEEAYAKLAMPISRLNTLQYEISNR